MCIMFLVPVVVIPQARGWTSVVKGAVRLKKEAFQAYLAYGNT